MTDAPSSPAGSAPGTPSASSAGSFFDWIRGFDLRRSDDHWLAGVAGGIAAHTRLDPLIIRGIFIVVAILGGPIFFLYAVAWALIPDPRGRIYLEQAIKGVFEPAMIAIGVVLLLTFVPFAQGLWWGGVPDWWDMPAWLESTLRMGWILAIVGGLIWLTVVLVRRMPRADSVPPTSHAGYWVGAPSSTGTPWTSQATPNDGTRPYPAPADPMRTAPTVDGQASTAQAPTAQAAQAASAPTAQVPTAPTVSSATSAPTSTWYGTPAAAHQSAPVPGAAEREAQRRKRDAERAQQRRDHEERYRRRQPGAAWVSIWLGLAVVAGTLMPILVGHRDWSNAALMLGLGTALGVLAIGTILAGIRGKESGALGFFAVVAIVAMLFTGVFPRGTAVSVVGNTTWQVTDADVGSPTGFAMVAGSPTLDLTGLDARSAEVGGVVDLWLGAGTLDVVVPADVPVVIEVNGLVTGLNYVNEDGSRNDRGGVFYRDEVRFGDTGSPDTTTVRIWVITGGVNLGSREGSER
ncbi:phage shock protein PspC (stress-responsive transcriptional regulator) [Mycetocola sp. CAN_C7]|uniref:PspC domain-containing protein n=1 Tax=Mycetocola sp. CAN_C7 TaxID=2787724 RepID=UPI0018CA1B5A